MDKSLIRLVIGRKKKSLREIILGIKKDKTIHETSVKDNKRILLHMSLCY